MPVEFVQAMAYIRLSVMLGLITMFLMAIFQNPLKHPIRLLWVLLLYFCVSFINQIISTFYSKPLAAEIIAVVGTPLLFLVAMGVWFAMRDGY